MDRSLHTSEESLLAMPEAARERVGGSAQLEPSRGATALGVAFAFGIHLAVIALSPREAAQAAVQTPPCEVEIFEPPPPPPVPEPEQQPEPVQAVLVERPKPVVMREAPRKEAPPPPKAAEDTPPPPAAPAPEPVVEKPSEPAPALVAAEGTGPSDHTIVQGANGSFGGRGTGGTGAPGGTGTGATGAKNGVVGGTGVSAAQPITLSLKDWRCPWPEDAEYEDFDQQVVSIRVVVDAEGRVEKADVLQDPGYGFGRAVRDCAMRQRAFVPAKDASGRAIKAVSPAINVRFVR